jgi:hypothetical protein
MGVETYDVITGHNSPAQTKAAEDAQVAATRDQYQRSARNSSREFSKMVGAPDAFIPVLSSISPTTAAGTAAPLITCTGSNFNEDSKIWWEGAVPLVTTYVSSTQLTVQLGTLNTWFPGGPRTVQISVRTDSSASVNKPFTIT